MTSDRTAWCWPDNNNLGVKKGINSVISVHIQMEYKRNAWIPLHAIIFLLVLCNHINEKLHIRFGEPRSHWQLMHFSFLRYHLLYVYFICGFSEHLPTIQTKLTKAVVNKKEFWTLSLFFFEKDWCSRCFGLYVIWGLMVQ